MKIIDQSDEVEFLLRTLSKKKTRKNHLDAIDVFSLMLRECLNIRKVHRLY